MKEKCDEEDEDEVYDLDREDEVSIQGRVSLWTR